MLRFTMLTIRHCLILFFTFIVSLNAAVQIQTDDVMDDFEMHYFYDASKTMTLEEVKAHNAFTTLRNHFSLGYHRGTSWFKISIKNNSQTSTFVLQCNEPFWSYLDAYIPTNDGMLIEKNGLKTPIAQRKIKSITPAFLLSIAPGAKRTIYLKGESMSGHLGAFTLFTADAYFAPTRMSITTLYALFLVLIGTIFLFNLYLYLMAKERVYLYYLLYIASFFIWISVISGISLRFALFDWPEALHSTGALTVALLLLFSDAFLEIKTRISWLHSLFMGLFVTILLLSLAIVLDIPYSSMAFNVVSTIFFILLFYAAIVVFKQGYGASGYYLFALIVYMPTLILMTLTFNALIEYSYLYRYAFIGGSLIEILFFNSLLIQRYAASLQQSNEIQRKLLEEREAFARELEQKIEQRTQELETSNKSLQEQANALESMQQQLYIESNTDALTGLFNRRYFTSFANEAFLNAKKEAKDLAICMIDIDDFKQINDQFGHDIGDLVLQQCASIINRFQESFSCAARYGGEEFVLIFEAQSSEVVKNVLQQMLHAFADDMVRVTENKTFHYFVSMGGAAIDWQNDEEVVQIVKRADAMMYQVKRDGKNALKFF